MGVPRPPGGRAPDGRVPWRGERAPASSRRAARRPPRWCAPAAAASPVDADPRAPPPAAPDRRRSIAAVGAASPRPRPGTSSRSGGRRAPTRSADQATRLRAASRTPLVSLSRRWQSPPSRGIGRRGRALGETRDDGVRGGAALARRASGARERRRACSWRRTPRRPAGRRAGRWDRRARAAPRARCARSPRRPPRPSARRPDGPPSSRPARRRARRRCRPGGGRPPRSRRAARRRRSDRPARRRARAPRENAPCRRYFFLPAAVGAVGLACGADFAGAGLGVTTATFFLVSCTFAEALCSSAVAGLCVPTVAAGAARVVSLRRHAVGHIARRLARRRVDDDALPLVQLGVVREAVDAREVARRQPVAPPQLGERVAGLRAVRRGAFCRGAPSRARGTPRTRSVTTRTLPGSSSSTPTGSKSLRTKICSTMRGCSFAVASRLFHSVSSSARTPNVVGDLLEAVAVARPVEDALAPVVGERAVGHRDQDGVLVVVAAGLVVFRSAVAPLGVSLSSCLGGDAAPRHDDAHARAQLARVLDAVQPPQLARVRAARARDVVERLAEAQHDRLQLVRVTRLVRAGGEASRPCPAAAARATLPRSGGVRVAHELGVQRLDHLRPGPRGARDADSDVPAGTSAVS